jgi:hypothetical protein
VNTVGTKSERLQLLQTVDVDDPIAGGLIDGFYTDFYITEDDRQCLERFLKADNIENRREALIALMFSTGPDGPKFTGYARDAIALHLLGILEDSEAQYTGLSVLVELRARGDTGATAPLESLETNTAWRRHFR